MIRLDCCCLVWLSVGLAVVIVVVVVLLYGMMRVVAFVAVPLCGCRLLLLWLDAA